MFSWLAETSIKKIYPTTTLTHSNARLLKLFDNVPWITR